MVMKGGFMNTEIRGVHYEITENDRELIEKKMHRIQFAEDNIVSLHFTIIKEKNEYKIEVTIHFRWGNQVFIHLNDFDLHEGIDKLFNKMELRISKEKERKKEHQK
jgi:ribosomal subunit interface protein